jgi:hypothetical protein
MSARVRLDWAEQVATQVAGPSLAIYTSECRRCPAAGRRFVR